MKKLIILLFFYFLSFGGRVSGEKPLNVSIKVLLILPDKSKDNIYTYEEEDKKIDKKVTIRRIYNL